MKKIIVTFFLFFLITSESKSERTYFYTTINELLKTGYTVIKVNDVNEGTSVYHLTNGKEIIICYTGSAWAKTRCLRE
jgi:hypothetical protein